MAEPLELESLFAAIGLVPILEGRPTLFKHQVRKAANLPADIRRRMLKFLSSTEFADAKELPPFDFEEISEQIAQGYDEADALFRAVPDEEMATDIGAMVNTIVLWADQLRPKETRVMPGGAIRPEEPDSVSLSDFRRAWQVAADPLTVMADLEDGSLSPDQVAVIAQLYPAIYQEMKQAVTDGMSALAGRLGPDWEPLPLKATLIRTLRQEDTEDGELAAFVQQMYAQDPDAQPPPSKPLRRSKVAGEAAADPTPGQSAQAGVT